VGCANSFLQQIGQFRCADRICAPHRLGTALIAVVASVVGFQLAGSREAQATAAVFGPARVSVASKSCPPGFVDANLSWGEKCLHEGESCKVGNIEYHAYGFDCPADGHLVDYAQPAPTTTTSPTGTTAAPPTLVVGRTVLLRPRTRTHACARGALPDRRCSPGAYYSKLTKSVICSASFRTGTIRNVSDTEKHLVEIAYGMVAQPYGRTIEIDHIVSLELGGSNDIANLFPEPGSGQANYHVRDKLENKLHSLVCAGTMTLHAAQTAIAANWQMLYTAVYGVAP
jgi:hypothetical protein